MLLVLFIFTFFCFFLSCNYGVEQKPPQMVPGLRVSTEVQHGFCGFWLPTRRISLVPAQQHKDSSISETVCLALEKQRIDRRQNTGTLFLSAPMSALAGKTENATCLQKGFQLIGHGVLNSIPLDIMRYTGADFPPEVCVHLYKIRLLLGCVMNVESFSSS